MSLYSILGILCHFLKIKRIKLVNIYIKYGKPGIVYKLHYQKYLICANKEIYQRKCTYRVLYIYIPYSMMIPDMTDIQTSSSVYVTEDPFGANDTENGQQSVGVIFDDNKLSSLYSSTTSLVRSVSSATSLP